MPKNDKKGVSLRPSHFKEDFKQFVNRQDSKPEVASRKERERLQQVGRYDGEADGRCGGAEGEDSRGACGADTAGDGCRPAPKCPLALRRARRYWPDCGGQRRGSGLNDAVFDELDQDMRDNPIAYFKPRPHAMPGFTDMRPDGKRYPCMFYFGGNG